jgi:hypothetical protein
MSDPTAVRPNDFVVRLDGLPLDDGARQRIAAALQSAAVAELGRLDLNKRDAFAYIPRKEWYGLWLRTIAQAGEFRGQDFAKPLEVTERLR